MKSLVFVLGCTCSGKTTFIETAKASTEFGDLFDSVNIGQILRKRHPPEYFEGKGAMAKTEPEVKALFFDAVHSFVGGNREYLLVDGMPRLVSQLPWVVDAARMYDIRNVSFLWFHADDDVRLARGIARDSDPAAVELMKNRLVGDKILYYDVLHALIERYDFLVSTINTTEGSSAYPMILHNLVYTAMYDNLI